jgi:hypothetical protein
MGPLLCLLYIHDLPLGIHIDSKLLLYADGTSVLISGTDIQEVQTKSIIALDNIKSLFMTNCLPLNLKKKLK